MQQRSSGVLEQWSDGLMGNEDAHDPALQHSSTPALQHSNAPALQVMEVAAGLVFRDGKVLITQRHRGSHLGGLWEFPGGKREPNETFEQCLVRELREELGIEVAIGQLVESVTHEYSDKAVHLKFFRCQWKEHEPQLLGCSAYKWVHRGELRNYTFPAADARLLGRLESDSALWIP